MREANTIVDDNDLSVAIEALLAKVEHMAECHADLKDTHRRLIGAAIAFSENPTMENRSNLWAAITGMKR